MSQTVELNQGEISVNFLYQTKGKLSFKDLVLNNQDLHFEGGLVRMFFDFEGIGAYSYFKMPTIEVAYQ